MKSLQVCSRCGQVFPYHQVQNERWGAVAGNGMRLDSQMVWNVEYVHLGIEIGVEECG